jgi:hypothetical protein
MEIAERRGANVQGGSRRVNTGFHTEGSDDDEEREENPK